MVSRKQSDFLKFCGDDIRKLHQGNDPNKKPHLLRKIGIQMYAEACKLNYSDGMICKMLSDDLDEYIQHSVPVQQKKFENMMKELNINVPSAPLNSKLQTPIENFPDTQKCEKICHNDKLFDDLDEFFNSMKRKPDLSKDSSIAGSSGASLTVSKACTPSNSIKISVDESNGDLVFDTNFRPKRALSQSKSYEMQTATTSKENRFSMSNNRTISNQSNFSEHRFGNDIRPIETVNSSSYNPYGAMKRKIDDIDNDFYKRTTYIPKPEPQIDEFTPKNDFKSATEELAFQYQKKYGGAGGNYQNDNSTPYNTNQNGGMRRTLGGKRTVNSKFTPPFANQNNNSNSPNQAENNLIGSIDMTHPRLKNVDPKMAETISNEIMDQCDRVEWDSIAGLEYAKKILHEAVVLPILRPDIFTGLRQPPKGVLLFGPPGTGKTLIGKCIASQSQSTFFSISASSLTSKWIGEGEKMVRALFAVAASMQPSVVFIDEVDSLLCARSESEHESSRRLKTEFLVQLDGASTAEKDRILIVGATNRPQELDEAARRRFVKRLYIPLPEYPARREIMLSLLSTINHVITESQFEEIARRTEGFSGADMKILCQEAVMGPIRSISFKDMKNVAAESVRPVSFDDFSDALKCVRASVSQDDLQQYVDWNTKFGSGSGF